LWAVSSDKYHKNNASFFIIFILMNIFLDDSMCRQDLYPFTHTRHVADIRVGLLTIREKWLMLSSLPVETMTALKNEHSIVIPANIIPSKNTARHIIAAAKGNTDPEQNDEVKLLRHPWQIFQLNDWALRADFELITGGRVSCDIPLTNQIINPGNIFVEEGAQVNYCILNASAGPIYIGKNAQIMEGSMIRGPFGIGEQSVLKMGAKIYGATSIGPFCVAGGEIKNSVLFGYSNKAHDGYLGDSVIGEWCNLGAGTSNSNVKNTGGDVRYQTAENAEGISAGNKAGLLMGDYSRSAINTSFNTGTVVGVCCNIFGETPPKYIPHFSWGKERYIFEKAVADINNWKKMKGMAVSPDEKNMLNEIYLNNK
jgi:UDP-N-acetylglucosamine diphosphorylase / glucose-1-phosphate thymidylyltransferase / UDP-N-acetylgalactosamine diphosphorylase / glucosamine-1-phosphate N-acetyltransferase / galactosamine-1-phosphate N-acetyltransferase